MYEDRMYKVQYVNINSGYFILGELKSLYKACAIEIKLAKEAI